MPKQVQATDNSLSEHIVLFLDLLGFSEASIQQDKARQAEILTLVQEIATWRREFEFHLEVHERGITTQLGPTISTFSDNIVISVPLDGLTHQQIKEEERWKHVLPTMQQLASQIATRALNIGFLIRGGLTVGPLFHQDGVVFGKAMVDAYRIESRIANYPRIVISRDLTSQFPTGAALVTVSSVVIDDDGLSILNIYNDLGRSRPPNLADYQRWFTQTSTIIINQIDDLSKKGKLGELAKWFWFARKFVQAMEPTAKYIGLEIEPLKLVLINRPDLIKPPQSAD